MVAAIIRSVGKHRSHSMVLGSFRSLQDTVSGSGGRESPAAGRMPVIVGPGEVHRRRVLVLDKYAVVRSREACCDADDVLRLHRHIQFQLAQRCFYLPLLCPPEQGRGRYMP